ncbi:MAG TPA: hypothetical protein VF733_00435, partial [Candidatus Saccharimonadales bacterium]
TQVSPMGVPAGQTGAPPPQINSMQAAGQNASQPAVPGTAGTQAAQNPATPPVTQQRDTAILDLARNDDLNVATLAREAQKRTGPPPDEVVISLH